VSNPTMIEAVARAIHEGMCSALAGKTDHGLPSWETKEGISRDILLAGSRAAIEAMREPTAAMSDAGGRVEFPAGEWNYSIDYAADEAWRAMIDAALAEEQR